MPGVFVFAVLAAAGCGPKAAPVRPPEAGRGESATPVNLALTGTGSCSARGCHGSAEPLAGDVQRNEFTSWVLRDPHARAYDVLKDDRSVRMAALLRLDKPGPGVAALGAFNMGGQSLVALGFYLYGDQAAGTVARETPLWDAWIQERFPMPTEPAR